MTSSLEILESGWRDQRKAFRSSCETLNDFLRRYARQHALKGRSKTVIAVREDAIAGYATYTPSEVRYQGRLPDPVLRLGRFAVDKAHEGCGVGAELMRWVFQRALDMRRDFACIGVVVDAKICSGADRYYERFGFETLDGISAPADTIPMFVSLKTVAAAVEEAASPNDMEAGSERFGEGGA